MGACASCLKSICCCGSSTTDSTTSLLTTTCGFAEGIHTNVNVEIDSNCKVISMEEATTEDIYLCEPCSADDDENEGGVSSDADCDEQYTLGYTEGKEVGYTNGKADGYSAGYADGQTIGYSAGYAEGKANGYDEGLAESDDGTDDEDSEYDSYTDAYQAGYNNGYKAGVAEQQSSSVNLTSIMSQVDEATAITEYGVQISYTNTDDDEVSAIISQDDEWVSSNDGIAVDADTGKVTIDKSAVKDDTQITIQMVEI